MAQCLIHEHQSLITIGHHCSERLILQGLLEESLNHPAKAPLIELVSNHGSRPRPAMAGEAQGWKEAREPKNSDFRDPQNSTLGAADVFLGPSKKGP